MVYSLTLETRKKNCEMIRIWRRLRKSEKKMNWRKTPDAASFSLTLQSPFVFSWLFTSFTHSHVFWLWLFLLFLFCYSFSLAWDSGKPWGYEMEDREKAFHGYGYSSRIFRTRRTSRMVSKPIYYIQFFYSSTLKNPLFLFLSFFIGKILNFPIVSRETSLLPLLFP